MNQLVPARMPDFKISISTPIYQISAPLIKPQKEKIFIVDRLHIRKSDFACYIF
jgi:hypothetical protein